jgi:hypothetical protein
MSAYSTFTREKTLDERDGPTDLQANRFSSRPMLSDGAISINPCFECYSKYGLGTLWRNND